MRFINKKRMIVLTCLFACGMPLWDSFAETSSSDSISPLGDAEAILDEEAISLVTLRDMGAATMYIPSKSSVLRSWQMHLTRPQGKRVSSSGELEVAVLEQLDRYVGGPLATKKILPVLELYEGLLSDENLKELKEKGMSPEDYPGGIYFAQLRWESLRLQVLGQVNQFLVVFIALPSGGESEYIDICRSLCPKIEIGKMDDVTGEVYSKGVFDHHHRKGVTDIRSGSRKDGETAFYGIRVSVDIAKEIENKGGRVPELR